MTMESFESSAISEYERTLARALLRNNIISTERFKHFISLRAGLDRDGRRYLGDILLERKLISDADLKAFFQENNSAYLDFIKSLNKKGFMSNAQLKSILDDPESATSAVTVVERLGFMTKDNFVRLFAKSGPSVRLGEWLVKRGKLDQAKLDDALAEQSIHTLEDYLLFHKILDKGTLDKIKLKLGFAS